MRNERFFLWIACTVSICCGLSGCVFSTDLLFEPPPVTPVALRGTPEPTATSAVLPSLTPLPPTAIPCAYAWANKDLPDETAEVQEALKKAGLGNVEAALSAYGENCLDTASGTITGFTAMQTDFFFSIPVDDLNNRAEMGNWAARILEVLVLFPPGKVPGPQSGYLGLVFSNGRDENRLWVKLDFGLSALEKGLRGEALYDALKSTS